MMVKIALIGAGLMGERHLITYQKLENVEIAAIADASEARLAEISQHYGVQRTFSDYQQMLKEVDIDAVSICTPDDFHRDAALAAIEHGKNLLVEKPLATNLADALEICQEAKKKGVQLMVGYCVRFMSPFDKIPSHLEKLGQIHSVTIDWYNRASFENGVVSEPNKRDSIISFLATHPLDLVRHLFGEAVQVSCEASSLTSLNEKRPDMAALLLRLDNDAIVQIRCNWGTAGTAHRVKFSLAIDAEFGHLACSSLDERLQVQTTSLGFELPISYDWQPMVKNELEHFVATAALGEQSLIDAKEGLKTLRLTLAAQEAAIEKKVITLDKNFLSQELV